MDHPKVNIVEITPTKGRGLIAIAPISCGQRVVDEAPLVMVEWHSQDIPVALFELDQRLHESGKVVLRLALRTNRLTKSCGLDFREFHWGSKHTWMPEVSLMHSIIIVHTPSLFRKHCGMSSLQS